MIYIKINLIDVKREAEMEVFAYFEPLGFIDRIRGRGLFDFGDLLLLSWGNTTFE
jgi:hypothetical protein